jgi:transcription termination factor Rho
MPVLERSELEASPLADLHAIADQLGLEGFRRLRKADLIDLILRDSSNADADADATANADTTADADTGDEPDAEEAEPSRRGRAPRLRRRRSRRAGEPDEEGSDGEPADAAPSDSADEENGDEEDRVEEAEPRGRRTRARGGRSRAGEDRAGRAAEGDAERASEAGPRVAEGIVEVLGNGSAFLRVDPPEPSDDDVYISAAQVRRCELVSGDRVSGPVRTPRRSERYPSLVRVEEINGASADTVSDGSRYEDLPVAWPTERIALDAQDPTLQAIEWLTPIGLGSRAVIVGGRGAGKSEMLRRLFEAVRAREDLEVSVALVGCRPEEIAQWQEGPVEPAAAVSFAASSEAQGQAAERAIDAARRVAARGGNALVLLDTLDGVHAHTARRILAAARNLRDAGSLTLVATASEPLGAETTVIALDAALAATGREPTLDLAASGTLRAELLVGDDGAQAITRARAAALEAAASH